MVTSPAPTLLALLCLLFPPIADAAAIAEYETTFTDSVRDRVLPIRIVHPAPLAAEHPVVLVSHGLGGSTEAMRYLGDHLARAGWIVVHLQHPGSDAAVLAGRRGRAALAALRRSLRDPDDALQRFRDPAFVLDALAEQGGGDGLLAGHLDLDRVAFAGHSYGARGALVAAGERIGPEALSFREPRIDAVVALSPNLPRRGEPDYGEVAVPILHVTGTEDGDPLARGRGFDPLRRTQPFERIEGVDQYLLVLDGADHATFGGRRLGTADERPGDRHHAEQVAEATRLFLDARLRGDARAREALVDAFPEAARWSVKPADG